MIIKTLHIEGFGKFTQKTIDFSTGLNLIEGLNESGKSTIHAFIEAMLYGFIDPLKSRKTLLDKHQKYAPKNQTHYGGALIIAHQGKDYRITRNLKKGVKNPVEITLENTGETITDTLDIHPEHKLPDIGKWLDLPYLVYVNTLSVSQDELGLNANLENDLISRLQSLDATASLSLDTNRALKELEKQRNAIGTDHPSSKKPYKETLDQLARLSDERRRLIENHEARLHDKAVLEEKKEHLKEKEVTLQRLNTHLAQQENQRRRDRFKKIATLHETLMQNEKALNALADVKDFKTEDLEHYREAIFHLEQTTLQGERIETKKSQLNEKYRELMASLPQETPVSLDTLEADIKAYQKQQSIYHETTYESLKKQYETWQKKQAKYTRKLQRLATLKKLKKRYLITLFVIVYATLGKAFIDFKKKRLIAKYATLETAYQKQEAAYQTLTQIQQTYQIETLYELEKAHLEALQHNRTKASLDTVKSELATLQEEANELTQQREKAQHQKRTIETRYGIQTLDALKAIQTKHQNYKDLITEQNYLKTSLATALEGKSFEEYQASIDMNAQEVSLEDYPSNLERAQNLDQTLQRLRLEIAQESQRLTSEEASERSLEAIDSDLRYYERKKQAYEKTLTTLDDAEKLIHRAISTIEENFAPALSKAIGEYLTLFTLGRYDTLKVRRNLAFKVETDSAKRLESNDYFSLGTLDQIYFAMRLGIIKTLKKDDVPLFLDDAFSAYDEERLHAVLEVLSILAKERQILLFTCHQREGKLLNTLRTRYHTISL